VPIPTGLSAQMPGPRVPACCSLERRGPEAQLLLHASGDVQGGDIHLDGHWQGWLRDWEERQSAQLDEQCRVIVETVEAMRDILLEHSEQNITKQMLGLRNELRAELELERSIRCALQAALASNPSGNSNQWTGNMAKSQKTSPKSVQTVRTDSTNTGKKLKVRFEDEDEQTAHQRTCSTPAQMDEALALACGSAAGTRRLLSSSSMFDENSAGNVSHVSQAHLGPITYKATFIPRLQYQKVLAKVVHTYAFNLMATCIIIAYTVAIGVQTEIGMRSAILSESPPRWTHIMDNIFTLLFGIELMLRMACELDWFFCGPGMAWNIFDLAVVACNMVEMADAVQVNLGFLRVVRALRAARALRLMRIFRIFRELRLMTASIMSSMTSLVWAFLLMLIVMYIFAVILLQGAGDFLREGRTQDDSNTYDEIRKDLENHFGTIIKTTYSLTQAISGGRSWGEYADIFLEINPWYGVVYGVFIVFMVFGVLNILTGIFVESTRNLANFDQDLVIQEELSQQESTINQIRCLFGEIDTDKSGTISLKELQDNLDDDRVKAYFALLHMDVTEAEGLFSLLDTDGSGEVSIVEFIVSCMRLKGQARSIDMAHMMFESKRLWRLVKKSLCQLDNDVKHLALQIYTSQAVKNLEAMDQTFEGTEQKEP